MAESNFIDHVKLQKRKSDTIHKKNGLIMQYNGDFTSQYTLDAFRY